ncbi:3-oxoacyl-ACP reductase [Paenibacillus daejeonensis]|uniref:3-oxoacyl-ACP reductase n=1 Tax=Paenibacillus daejeonensis TaxID=135193 RepID=UPI000364EB82|nr:3-oxoacyl-ACP reductase [Paenibacillus daejeonensis]
MKRCEGKTVLVTGGSRGIGAAIARAFAAEGALVIVNYVRNEAAALAVESECGAAGGSGWAIKADITRPEQVSQMIATVSEETGGIDVLVNNAFPAYSFDPEQRKMAWELQWEDYQTQLDGSLRASFEMCRSVIPVMRQRGQGRIINMISNLLYTPVVPYHDYTTAKAALAAFSRNLAADLGPYGITVNCVAPGLVYPTDASQTTREDVRAQIRAQTPLRRLAVPEDVAGPVVFLATEGGRFMTGQTLVVDGGLTMREGSHL